MILYLLRHGIAEDTNARGDRARALTAEGQTKMRTVARGLVRLKLAPVALFSSPLLRAKQTAEILKDALNDQAARPLRLAVTDTLSPPGDLESFLAVARTAAGDDAEAGVFAVAHEPFLGHWIGQLCFGRAGRCQLKKGAVAAIELPSNHTGRLLWLLQPRQLRALA